MVWWDGLKIKYSLFVLFFCLFFFGVFELVHSVLLGVGILGAHCWHNDNEEKQNA
ncbi:hypothetical protein RchiOBHm_Chr3g0478221 [Rosa chinensis]|uniref:Uncharacterized protein n=1 Tax=Rosa chinensis TaxID=74649 RepID=A0A2P6RD44_ROSCH|nr:hypothetical protein RchiOBHm_Chr3g0478221 [Rosa chinensis]